MGFQICEIVDSLDHRTYAHPNLSLGIWRLKFGIWDL
jgi:hypothetical protein